MPLLPKTAVLALSTPQVLPSATSDTASLLAWLAAATLLVRNGESRYGRRRPRGRPALRNPGRTATRDFMRGTPILARKQAGFNPRPKWPCAPGTPLQADFAEGSDRLRAPGGHLASRPLTPSSRAGSLGHPAGRSWPTTGCPSALPLDYLVPSLSALPSFDRPRPFGACVCFVGLDAGARSARGFRPRPCCTARPLRIAV